MEKELQKKSLDTFFRTEYQKLVNYVRKNLEERFFEVSRKTSSRTLRWDWSPNLTWMPRSGTWPVTSTGRWRIRSSLPAEKQRNVSIERFTDTNNWNYLLNTITDETPDEETVYSNMEPEMLRQAISELRPDEQAVIIATEFENQSYEELSKNGIFPSARCCRANTGRCRNCKKYY